MSIDQQVEEKEKERKMMGGEYEAKDRLKRTEMNQEGGGRKQASTNTKTKTKHSNLLILVWLLWLCSKVGLYRSKRNNIYIYIYNQGLQHQIEREMRGGGWWDEDALGGSRP